jgi:hypothetical protein
MLKKIVSGGQTGVDRAALDAAIQLKITHGGWCPQGRLAEDGAIAKKYKLRETAERDYAVRTAKNVLDSDATLIIHRGKLTGGTLLTSKLAKRQKRPIFIVDLKSEPTFDSFFDWLTENKIAKLNVAGPRESTTTGIYEQAYQLLVQWFSRL